MSNISLIVKDLKQEFKSQPQRIARINSTCREKLGVNVGDFVEIIGNKRTVAVVQMGLKVDLEKEIVRLDSFVRKSAGTTIESKVSVRHISVEKGKQIILSPVDMRLNVDDDFENFVKTRLMGQPFCSGNDLPLVMLGHPIQFKVVRTDPRDEPVQISSSTILKVLPEPLEYKTPSNAGEQGIRQFLRFEWLKNMQVRISSDRILFSILDHSISSENEDEIISAALKIADETFKPVKIDVTFESKGRIIGTLSWAIVDMVGNITPNYPDIQMPTPIVTPTINNQTIVTPMKRCFKIGTRNCPKNITFSPKAIVVAMPFKGEFEDAYKFAIRPALEEAGFTPWKANEQISTIDVMCKVCHAIQQSGYLIANITNWNANVVFELGLAYGLARTVILVKHKKDDVPVDLKGLEYIEYSNIEELKNNLSLFLKGIQTVET